MTEPPTAKAHRYRVRFAKVGLLTMISHNDLMRVWDRILRRTGLPLRFTEGFHAKPIVSSPLSLALGVEGEDEVFDFELTSDCPVDEVERLLQSQVVDGLRIVSVSRRMGPRGTLAVAAVEYRCSRPSQINETEVKRRAEAFSACDSWTVERSSFGKPSRTVDIRPWIETIVIESDGIRFRLKVQNGQTARPEEVLALLGLDERTTGERPSICRSRVELLEDERLTKLAVAHAPLGA